MGFEAPGTGEVLTFEGTQYAGLEVTVDSVPLGLLLEVMQDFQAYQELVSGQAAPAKAAPLLVKMLDTFGGALEAWNVTKRGEPVPPTPDGLRSLDKVFAMSIIGAWLSHTAAASDDLGKDSTSGESSPEELEAMAALSQSLPSSGEQNF